MPGPDPDSSLPPAQAAPPPSPPERRNRRRRRRLRQSFWLVTAVVVVVVSLSAYLYLLIRGPKRSTFVAPPDQPYLEEAPPLVRGLPQQQDSDAVRRKLISKGAPSPTLTGIARHKASEMSRPVGPAYDPASTNVELAAEQLDATHPLVQEAAAALEDYRKATSVANRQPVVFESGDIEKRMSAWYGLQQTASDPVPGELKGATLITAGESKVVMLGYECPQRPDALLPAYFHRAPGGRLLLDWEAWTAWGEMSIPDFKRSRSLIPILMRLVASESNYYNYEFADTSRFLAVKLRSADGQHSITGYVLRKSLLGTAVANLIGVPLLNKLPDGTPMPPLRRPGTKSPVTLRVAFPPSSQSDHCVMITELIADRWMVFPGEAH